MAVRKTAPKETPDDRAAKDRIRRGRPHKRDYLQCSELAYDYAVDLDDVLDQFDERAAVREYEGNVTRDEAERLAMLECWEFFKKRSR